MAEQAATARQFRGLSKFGESESLDVWTWTLPVEDSRLLWAAVEERAATLRSGDRDLTAGQSRCDALTSIVVDKVDITVHLHAAIPQRSALGLAVASHETAQPVAAPSAASPTQAAPVTSPSPSATAVRVTGLGCTDTTLVRTEWLERALDSGLAVIDEGIVCDAETGGLLEGDITKGFRPSSRRPRACQTVMGATRSTDVDPRYRIPEAVERFVKVPRQEVPLPRLPSVGPVLRPGPCPPLAERPDRRGEPHLRLSSAPPPQADTRLVGDPARGCLDHMGHPHGAAIEDGSGQPARAARCRLAGGSAQPDGATPHGSAGCRLTDSSSPAILTMAETRARNGPARASPGRAARCLRARLSAPQMLG